MTNVEQHVVISNLLEEPKNKFKIIHLHNGNNKYHLTRQVLLDSTLTQNTYTFFYHILSFETNIFNKMYGSFACLIERNDIEADIYLNVNQNALNYIIQYIQTGKMNFIMLYENDWKFINEIIDLATIFGMPKLVTDLRESFIKSNQIVNNYLQLLKNNFILIMQCWKNYTNNEEYDIEKYTKLLDKIIDENKESIIDMYLKILSHYNPSYNIIILLINILVIIYLMTFLNTNQKEQKKQK